MQIYCSQIKLKLGTLVHLALTAKDFSHEFTRFFIVTISRSEFFQFSF